MPTQQSFFCYDKVVIKQLKREFTVSDSDKVLIESILAKVDKAKEQNDTACIMDLEYLRSILSADELEIINRVFAIQPEIYGFKGPYLGVEPVPDNLIKIEKQPYYLKGEKKFTNIQYLPKLAYDAFKKMADAMQTEIGRPLIIDSGYRSNTYQVIIFLETLKIYDFDVSKTITLAAIPGYSEHCTSNSPAIDFINIDGLPTDGISADFENTPEYEWLTKNAGKYNFFLSFPRDNRFGQSFEPWHWRHIPS